MDVKALLLRALLILVAALSGSRDDRAGAATAGDRLDRVTIGQALFYSPRLSADGEQACASCHIQELAFQDGYERALSRTRTMTRNTPSLLNVNRYSAFAWDGRGATIEQQIANALFAPQELDANDESLSAAVRTLPGAFAAQQASGESLRDYVVNTLGAYVRSLATTDTRFDDWRRGSYTPTSSESRGRELFEGRAGCSRCHAAPDLTDGKFHRTGLWSRPVVLQTVDDPGTRDRWRLGLDYGRGDIVAGQSNMRAFRTPSLYNVARTAPYMHDGSLPTLSAVIDFYARGGDEPNAAIARLELTGGDKRDLLAFLNLLTDKRYARVSPPSDRDTP